MFFSLRGSRTADAKRVRPQVEALEAREVPALASWTGYVPHAGDRVDALIGQLLPGTRSGVEFFQDLTGWLATSIAPQVREDGDANSFLAQLAGDCTVRSTIFETVADRLGIPVQTVALHNVPIQGSHEADEVALHGRWYFFDPTTGVYLARKGETDPLGLPEARAHARGVEILESTSPHWRGVWSAQRDFTYSPAPADLLRVHGRSAFLLHYTYLHAPVTISGPNVPTSP